MSGPARDTNCEMGTGEPFLAPPGAGMLPADGGTLAFTVVRPPVGALAGTGSRPVGRLIAMATPATAVAAMAGITYLAGHPGLPGQTRRRRARSRTCAQASRSTGDRSARSRRASRSRSSTLLLPYPLGLGRAR